LGIIFVIFVGGREFSRFRRGAAVRFEVARDIGARRLEDVVALEHVDCCHVDSIVSISPAPKTRLSSCVALTGKLLFEPISPILGPVPVLVCDL
jgi:hypothetical protein